MAQGLLTETITAQSSSRAISYVIPVFNEQESLEELVNQILAAPAKGLSEIIFVDDGSTDESWNRICRTAARFKCVKGLQLLCHAGKATALAAGFRFATGTVIVTLDADLQDNPSEIPRLLDELERGFDLVVGWKKDRHDPWHKVWPSRVFNYCVSQLTKVRLHDHNCGMKCFKREVVIGLALYGELHRFIPVMAASRGFKVIESPVSHRARRFGQSKYGLGRFAIGALDLITVLFMTRYSLCPAHVIGLVGLSSACIGAFGLLYLAFLWAIGAGPIGTRPLLAYSIVSVVFGVQMISLGIVSELIVASARAVNGVRDVSIKATTP